MLSKKAREYLNFKRRQFRERQEDREFTSAIAQQRLSGSEQSSSPKSKCSRCGIELDTDDYLCYSCYEFEE